jgi:hypothetical protein
MGMDVFGKAPDDPKGAYFRNNIWWWHPLAAYCVETAPDLTASCQSWHSNEGDGLDADTSRQLAAALRQRIADGQTAAYAAIREAEHHALPDEPCDICGGTGSRLAPPEVRRGNYPCLGCNGKGRIRPRKTQYPFSVENVEEFATFLEHCNGFAIW